MMLNSKFILTAALAMLAVSCSDSDTNTNDGSSQASPVKTKIIAHRGYWNAEGVGAQNSIASLKAAQDFGAYGSEFDVNMTSDNKLVVVHGPSTTGISDVRATTFENVRAVKLSNGEPIPTLDEYLEQGAKNKNVKLILEVKAHATAARETEVVTAILNAVEKAGMDDQMEYISFSIHVCKELVRLKSGVKVAYLNGDLSPQEIKDLGITGLDYQRAKFTANSSWLREAFALGLTVNVWTINATSDMEWAVNKGVDFVTTDYPNQVQEIIDKKKAS